MGLMFLCCYLYCSQMAPGLYSRLEDRSNVETLSFIVLSAPPQTQQN